jgi:hypothetical protein
MGTAVKQELYAFTVGEDTEWRTLRIRGEPHGVLYGDPGCDDGAVYWYSQGYNDGWYFSFRTVRFDLTTEKITSELRQFIGTKISCHYNTPVPYRARDIGIRWFGELKGGWLNSINVVPHEVYSVRKLNVAPHEVYSVSKHPGPQALQRGHLLRMEETEGVLRAHPILSSTAYSIDIAYSWDSKTLVVTGSVEEEEEEHAEQYSGNRYSRFVAVRRRRQGLREAQVPIVGRLPYKHGALSVFPYVPTVSPAPFALYLGTPHKEPAQSLKHK